MTKKSLKIIILLTAIAIPQTINEGYSPRLEKLEKINAIELAEKNRTNAMYRLIELNEDIDVIERKKEFLVMRLNERDLTDSLKNNYLRKLNETNKELREYYSKKDSIYKLIEE